MPPSPCLFPSHLASGTFHEGEEGGGPTLPFGGILEGGKDPSAALLNGISHQQGAIRHRQGERGRAVVMLLQLMELACVRKVGRGVEVCGGIFLRLDVLEH